MPYDAHPVRDLEAAQWWLIKKLPREDLELFVSDEDVTPPLVAELVCDTYWINPRFLRKSLKRKLRELGGD